MDKFKTCFLAQHVLSNYRMEVIGLTKTLYKDYIWFNLKIVRSCITD